MADEGFSREQIAPCGMDCAICLAFLRKTKTCPGCRGRDIDKSISRAGCRIKNCAELKNNHLDYCYGCPQFPCRRMKQLDRRYRLKYHYSMIECLENIAKNGVEKFIEAEKKRWTCSACGGIVCLHRGFCFDCGKIKYRSTGTNRAKNK